VAHSIEADLKRVPGTREVRTVGGPGRAVLVEMDPTRMAGVGVTVADLRQALQSANLGLPVGELISGNRRWPSRRARSCATPARWPTWWWACAPASRCSCATWPRCATARRPPQLCVARPAAKDGAAPVEHPAVTLAVTKKAR
jgi:hypothetical protein